ncbi:DegV family protein [Atopobium sp. oral taxon 199]|uniref:DegV family protein n=1 Tax=Atopobium sp. oral taxon 199 TaxID=712156 RepID=UPI00034EAB5E|nr:DegV family protein [Atopobium sp. oral taxon 199]EPD78374.1 hypothetical protein HMPREF1527_00694 [Atopobium sp. oral taxon 199 str. F0494]
MAEKRIAILTDSGTNTPAEFIAAHDIRVAPLRINYSDGSSYESMVDITPEQLAARFDEEIPSTSLPSPETIRSLFEDAKAAGYDAAIFVCISSGLSATCDTVRMIADDISDFPITVVDTKNIGVAAGLIVIEAVRLIEAGVPYEQIGEKLEEASRKTHVFFSVPALDFLRKGGRISEAVYRIGSVLNIKPVLTCEPNGKYGIAKRTRGWEKSLKGEVALVADEAKKHAQVHLAISCSAPSLMYAEMKERLRQEIPNIIDFITADIGPDLLVHTGPGLVGIGVQGVD